MAHILFIIMSLPVYAQVNTQNGVKILNISDISLKKDSINSISQNKNDISPSLNKTGNVNFEIGLRDELVLMFVNEHNFSVNRTENTLQLFLPINLHLCAGVEFLDHYKIDIRFGLLFVYEDFSGLDEGIFFQGDLFDRIYGTAGADFFYDTPNSHNGGGSGGNFILYGIGLGYKTSDNFNIDMMFYLPDKKVFGFDRDNSYSPAQTYNKVNNGLVKLGFQYSFIF